ncbi:dTMP kinase [Aquirhabdus sp.]|uniref:dTMP kinase n=1 Tax=Aquirhabdus sp. TaxID=2824160 RepID=UPI00396CD964
MFISFEGTEGVGKSTLIQGVAAHLDTLKIEYILTREPGGTPLAEQIRGLLLTPDGEKIAPACELLLLFAARAQHISQVIEPALAAGKWVLCDRFVDASFAYQCGGRALPTAQVQVLVDQFVSVLPNKTFWLDAPVEIGMARASKRGALDRFEQERLEFFERVRAVYTERAIAESNRIIRVDATLAASDVLKAVLNHL